MPDIDFLEKYPLYRKFKSHSAAQSIPRITKVNIKPNLKYLKYFPEKVMSEKDYDNYILVSKSINRDFEGIFWV